MRLPWLWLDDRRVRYRPRLGFCRPQLGWVSRLHSTTMQWSTEPAEMIAGQQQQGDDSSPW